MQAYEIRIAPYRRRCGRPYPRRHCRALAGAMLLLALLLSAPALRPIPAGAASGPVVLVPPGAGRAYTSEPGSHALLLVRRDGTVVAAQHFESDPTALALDQKRGLLYVALHDSRGILVLRSASLERVRTLPAVAAATRLVAVPGRNALYLFDPATRRVLYLTYTDGGIVHLAPLVKRSPSLRPTRRRATRPATTGQLHVFVSPYSARARQEVTFWASGFRPGETVSISWGAHDQGSVRADRYGIVGGAVAAAASAARGPHSVGLYGISSHRALTQIVTLGPVRDGHRLQRRAPPPLYLGFLPGPRATLSAPMLHRRVRIPYSASALPVVPVLAALGWLMSRRKRKRADVKRARGTKKAASRRR